MGFRDHFSAQATQYAAFRPTYPPALAAWLADRTPGRSLAWDCATGQGQAARILAPYFDRVIATDASAAQIANAPPAEGVEFRVADAAASGLPDESCDLVTVAQAAHWFDLPAFYAEARRVLRPGGVLALWCYVLLFTGDAAIDAVAHGFQNDDMEAYWPPGREIVDAKYTTIPFPFERIDLDPAAPAFHMEMSWTREDLVGYVSSWSAVARYRAARQEDPMSEFVRRVESVWAEGRVVQVRWPIYLLAGRRS
jgi:SAM-dependent methyltransferase